MAPTSVEKIDWVGTVWADAFSIIIHVSVAVPAASILRRPRLQFYVGRGFKSTSAAASILRRPRFQFYVCRGFNSTSAAASILRRRGFNSTFAAVSILRLPRRARAHFLAQTPWPTMAGHRFGPLV